MPHVHTVLQDPYQQPPHHVDHHDQDPRDRLNTHTLPSYTLVDMAVGYDFSKLGLKGFSAQLNVNNLTDEDYVATCNSLYYCYYGAERSIVGSVSWKF
jgi:iron complex outermembrane receptor protein